MQNQLGVQNNGKTLLDNHLDQIQDLGSEPILMLSVGETRFFVNFTDSDLTEKQLLAAIDGLWTVHRQQFPVVEEQ